MIERHYVGSKLIKSFDFDFGFCIPGSLNTWEIIYTVPLLDKRMRKEMLATPGATKVDSFFFAEGQLIMHNKACFTFCDDL
ncbi:delta subunit of GMP phosphodiesterase [Catenaria anguillulae PL171]|uniref:Delta subunit of GMP phosphodiesterase n=1 Tax=Catenaria anguillulae PL171 TaxID=765915 RepID=A0A1Y2HAU3_9FUNG|nr:delta subunit of GMP phosphodiesterase [Catenaria anguillulae PL171]